MIKALRIITIAVDVLLLIDIATDLVKKYKERRTTVSDPEVKEEPAPVTES